MEHIMKRIFILLLVLVIIKPVIVEARPINQADTPWEKTLEFTLINSLSEPITNAINEIYKDSPEQVSWAPYLAKIKKIKQLEGVGGSYEVTLIVLPYYGAHNTIGLDEITVRVAHEVYLVNYKHLKSYPIRSITL
jgi:Protein of unknown function (DUF3888)